MIIPEMNIAVIADDTLMNEFMAREFPPEIHINHLKKIDEIKGPPLCYAYFDLSFEPTPERLKIYESLSPAPVFINCVHLTHEELHKIAGFHPEISELSNTVRINAWPTFLKRNILEIAETSMKIDDVFKNLNWKYEIVPDIPGCITPRVISMIINEAYMALDEKVSTKEEIDTAMKLGTNYPYGPFEWSRIIGLKNVYDLLLVLAGTDSRYQPSSLLQKEALLQ